MHLHIPAGGIPGIVPDRAGTRSLPLLMVLKPLVEPPLLGAHSALRSGPRPRRVTQIASSRRELRRTVVIVVPPEVVVPGAASGPRDARVVVHDVARAVEVPVGRPHLAVVQIPASVDDPAVVQIAVLRLRGLPYAVIQRRIAVSWGLVAVEGRRRHHVVRPPHLASLDVGVVRVPPTARWGVAHLIWRVATPHTAILVPLVRRLVLLQIAHLRVLRSHGLPLRLLWRHILRLLGDVAGLSLWRHRLVELRLLLDRPLLGRLVLLVPHLVDLERLLLGLLGWHLVHWRLRTLLVVVPHGWGARPHILLVRVEVNLQPGGVLPHLHLDVAALEVGSVDVSDCLVHRHLPSQRRAVLPCPYKADQEEDEEQDEEEGSPDHPEGLSEGVVLELGLEDPEVAQKESYDCEQDPDDPEDEEERVALPDLPGFGLVQGFVDSLKKLENSKNFDF